jgi:hypothetical protein
MRKSACMLTTESRSTTDKPLDALNGPVEIRRGVDEVIEHERDDSRPTHLGPVFTNPRRLTFT